MHAADCTFMSADEGLVQFMFAWGERGAVHNMQMALLEQGFTFPAHFHFEV